MSGRFFGFGPTETVPSRLSIEAEHRGVETRLFTFQLGGGINQKRLVADNSPLKENNNESISPF